jgi:hypothetical protein
LFFVKGEPMSAKDFVFTEGMIGETKRRKGEKRKEVRKKGCNPLPSALKNVNHDFALIAWDAWIHLVPVLKKELGRRAHERLTENKNNPLFNLSWENGKFKLHILQDWAAEKLGLPKIYTFKKDPIAEYAEIACKFIK